MHPLLNYDELTDPSNYGGSYLNADRADDIAEKYGFIPLGSGRHRRTYLSPNRRYVIKIPLSKEGVHANYVEHKLWHKYKNHTDPRNHNMTYAPCRLINGKVLLMWAMTATAGDTVGCSDGRESADIGRFPVDMREPDWAHNVDSCQYGILRNGRVAAYDYGSNYY